MWTKGRRVIVNMEIEMVIHQLRKRMSVDSAVVQKNVIDELIFKRTFYCKSLKYVW